MANKKGQSAVITNLIILLLVIIAVGIIWSVVQTILEEQTTTYNYTIYKNNQTKDFLIFQNNVNCSVWENVTVVKTEIERMYNINITNKTKLYKYVYESYKECLEIEEIKEKAYLRDELSLNWLNDNCKPTKNACSLGNKTVCGLNKTGNMSEYRCDEYIVEVNETNELW